MLTRPPTHVYTVFHSTYTPVFSANQVAHDSWKFACACDYQDISCRYSQQLLPTDIAPDPLSRIRMSHKDGPSTPTSELPDVPLGGSCSAPAAPAAPDGPDDPSEDLHDFLLTLSREDRPSER